MKYTKVFYFLAQLGLILLAILFGLRMVAAIMAAATPILDAVIGWLYEHAIVGGLMVGIAILVWWFADECQKQVEKERNGKC